MNWIERLILSLKTGQNVKMANNGKPIDELVIRYENLYFCIDIDAESGEPTGDFAWSNDPGMFHAKIKDMYIAKRDTK